MSADPWAPTGVRDETIQQAPIYARLVTLWHQSGRTVPGRRDQEWSRLTAPPRFSTRPAHERERFSPHPPPDPGPDLPDPPVEPAEPAEPAAPTESAESTESAEPAELAQDRPAHPSVVRPSVVRPREGR